MRPQQDAELLRMFAHARHVHLHARPVQYKRRGFQFFKVHQSRSTLSLFNSLRRSLAGKWRRESGRSEGVLAASRELRRASAAGAMLACRLTATFGAFVEIPRQPVTGFPGLS